MAIGFLPIDIQVDLPDENVLYDYIEKYKIDTKHTTWKVAPVLGRVNSESWYKDKNTYIEQTYHRFDTTITAIPQYANNIDKLIPQIPKMLEQLPFRLLTFAIMLEQLQEVTPHTDAQKQDVVTDLSEMSIEMEPRRYNFLLTKHSVKSFYVSENYSSKKFYPVIPKERPCFAFCEKYHLHGADYIGPGKIMLLTGGILDREKHRKMVEENLIKFKKEAIIFPDPVDEVEIVGSGVE